MRQVLRMARVALVVLPAVVLALPTSASAQGGSALGFALYKPFIDGTELLNTAWQIGYTRPVGSYGLEIQLPLGMGRPEGADGGFAIGNPYVGLNMASGSMTYFGGVNLPVTPVPEDFGEAAAVGALGAWDWTDMSASPDYLTVTAGVSGTSGDAAAMNYFFGASPQIGLYLGDIDALDGSEISIRGWGGLNYPMDAFNLNAGVKASFWLTQGDVGGDAAHFGVFGGGSTAAGPGTVGAALTLPLSGDWSDVMSAALGVTYSLPL